MMVEFVVELGAEEDAKGDDVEPEEQSNAGTERSVYLGVVGEAGDVPAEDEGGNEPHEGRSDGSGKNSSPGLPERSAHVIDESDDADISGQRDGPASDDRNEVDGRADGGCEVQRKPGGEEIPEDDQEAGNAKGDERERYEGVRTEAAAPEGPAVGREVVGATDALH